MKLIVTLSALTGIILHFDNLKLAFCTSPWVEPDENCPATGVVNITFRNYCEMFAKCDHGVLVLVTCPDGLHFNPRKKHCDFPKNVKTCERLDKLAATTAKSTPQLLAEINQNFECDPVDIIVKKRGKRRCKVQVICSNGISFLLKKCMQTISFRL